MGSSARYIYRCTSLSANDIGCDRITVFNMLFSQFYFIIIYLFIFSVIYDKLLMDIVNAFRIIIGHIHWTTVKHSRTIFSNLSHPCLCLVY